MRGEGKRDKHGGKIHTVVLFHNFLREGLVRSRVRIPALLLLLPVPPPGEIHIPCTRGTRDVPHAKHKPSGELAVHVHNIVKDGPDRVLAVALQSEQKGKETSVEVSTN